MVYRNARRADSAMVAAAIMLADAAPADTYAAAPLWHHAAEISNHRRRNVAEQYLRVVM